MNTPHRSRPRIRWQAARAVLAATTLLGSLLAAEAVPTYAADGTLFANTPARGVPQLTLPGAIWLPGALGGHIWVSDNVLGFCRVDGPPDPTYGTYSVNATTCNTMAKSPAEAAYDSRTNPDGTHFVYLADNSTKSGGAVRVTFNPATETVNAGGILLGDGGTAGRTNSIALNPADGKLYLGHVKGGSILRITNPNGDIWSQFTEIVGRTTDGRGVRGGMAFVCGAKAGTCDLYIGEVGGNGVSVIPDAQACNPFGIVGGCEATVTSITTNSPGGLTSDGTKFLFVGDSPLSGVGTVLRYNVDTDTQDIVSTNVPAYQASFPSAHTQTTYTGITGIAIDGSGNLYVGDDPTLGAVVAAPPTGQGHLWKIAGVYQSTTQCNATATPPVTTGCLDALGSPGNPAQITPPPALAQPAKLIAWGATSPHGAVWIPGALGGHYWMADHTQGLCRLDPAPDDPGLLTSNPLTCDPMGTTGSPGQPLFDPVGNFIFVPDAAVRSPGIWRLTFDPATETISTPTLMAPGAGLDNHKLVGLAMGPDGNLYAASLQTAFVYRVQNPRGDPTTMAVDIVGRTSDNRGINGSIGMLGSDLYLPENKGATVIKNVTACGTATVPCTATPLSLPGVLFASSIATDQKNGVVYVAVASGAANATIFRYNPVSTAMVVYATRAQLPIGLTPTYPEDCTITCIRRPDLPEPANGIVGFHFPLGMSVDGSGNLVLGDDIMAGVRGFHGHIWSVPYTP